VGILLMAVLITNTKDSSLHNPIATTKNVVATTVRREACRLDGYLRLISGPQG
jgi:hypothetical protein